MLKNIFSNLKKQVNDDKETLKNTKVKTVSELQNAPKNKIFEPRELNQMFDVAKTILNGNIAYVNLNKFSEKDIESFKQFMCGVLFAVEGDWSEMSHNQFIFSPTKIEVSKSDK